MIDYKLQQDLRTKYNPDGSNLRNLQLQILDILIEIDKICRENNIIYWMSGGTMLGAIRHEGFIPWDDDIDIEMYKEDYEKFKRVVLSSGFSKKSLFLQCHETDGNYLSNHSKIVDTSIVPNDIFNQDLRYKYRGIFVDVFILEKNVGCVYKMFMNHGRILGRLLMKSANSDLIWRVTKLYSFTMSFVMGIFRYVGVFIGKDFYLSLGNRWKAVAREKNVILPVKDYIFEGHLFYGPLDYNKYLTDIFGDYMKLPKVIKQHVNFSK